VCLLLAAPRRSASLHFFVGAAAAPGPSGLAGVADMVALRAALLLSVVPPFFIQAALPI